MFIEQNYIYILFKYKKMNYIRYKLHIMNQIRLIRE